jgi:17beta-estradiol 17-dehydrogenase / very-long-chain 3-oxoacyl-CoA reductase
VYAGTKAYIDCFSRSLDAEYAQHGVSVQNQAPLFVATKMSKIRWDGVPALAVCCDVF